MASRFMTFVIFTYVFAASAALWNSIGIFGMNNILVDNTNTVGGILNSLFCSAGSNGVISSCTNQMLLVLGVITIVTLGSGLVTVLAFGNTYMAFGIFLSFVPAMLTLYDSITGIMDVFNVGSVVAVAIGGMFSIVFTILFAQGVMQIQSKTVI